MQSRSASAAAALDAVKAQAAEYAAEADAERQRCAEAMAKAARLADQLEAASVQLNALQNEKRQVCRLVRSLRREIFCCVQMLQPGALQGHRCL